MPSRILAKPARLLMTSLGLLFFLGLLLYFIPIKSAQSVSVPLTKNTVAPSKQKQASSSLPVRLNIPKININIALEPVGLTPQGAMGVPQGHLNAAWFNLGPRPGEIGSAVIDGHYGIWKSGQAAVFNNLVKLHRGDKIYVIDAQGATTTFIVREFQTYDQNADASEVFFSPDGKSHLNLITCAGAWNKNFQNYSKRFVVFTDKESF